MRIAALYDIHGNLPALKAVLKEVEKAKIDQVVVGGDVILGPMSKQCLDMLLEVKTPIYFIIGNCETSVLDYIKNKPLKNIPENVLKCISWTADQLPKKYIEFLAAWPKTITLNVKELGNVFFCHATPKSETQNFTRLTPIKKLLTIFEGTKEQMIVCGHTHMQFDLNIGKYRISNAGSVGMPFGNPGAYWLILGTKFDFRYTNYNFSKAANDILKTSYPDAANFAENNVLNSPSEEMMLKIFNRIP